MIKFFMKIHYNYIFYEYLKNNAFLQYFVKYLVKYIAQYILMLKCIVQELVQLLYNAL